MSKNIKENWRAIEAVEAEIKKMKDDPEAGFNAGSLFFDERKLMIMCKYRKKTKKGYTAKYYDLPVMANIVLSLVKNYTKMSNEKTYSNLPFDEYRAEIYSEFDSETFKELDVSGFRHSGTEIQVSALLYSLDFHPRMAATY